MVLTFDPFRELDRLAGQVLGAAPGSGGAATAAMPMDLYRSGDHFVLHCDLAGVDPGSVQVDVDNRILTIRAERSPRTDSDVQWLRRERVTGTFERRLTLGDGLDLDRIAATWQDGVLTLTIPIAQAAKPRRIDIATPTAAPALQSEGGPVVEGSAQERPAVSS
ncbi:Hsp20/alpha crystallin family protein [Couchioplanes caeruleus]|uniref:Heat-shock protein Hsp20 n=2 Tax=Couchioplanes caeruleus TaxID=56438 RepID=A0A1K0GX66_9ACTN|nr:Hsp20/alpha crystallin family protein [Couchioplanes caeruleus]OJF16004.1 heat-shock protein Hsp20 [Couchioplanes caeruleus subsp. caeruleus]ROP27862.1 heat shock protein Hsp20 [Couchioplanes caeruleus]